MFFVWGDTARKKKRKLMGLHDQRDRSFHDCNGSWCCSAPFASGSTSTIDPGNRRLSLCTETLGTESCEMAAEEEWEEEMRVRAAEESAEREEMRMRSRSERRRTGKKEFPPPLRWLEPPGRWLRAERRDGRLILREVQIERTDFFRASREDGRLRLYPIESDGDNEPDEDKGEEDAMVAAAAPHAEEEEEAARGEWQRDELIWCNGMTAGGHSEAAQWWGHRWPTCDSGVPAPEVPQVCNIYRGAWGTAAL